MHHRRLFLLALLAVLTANLPANSAPNLVRSARSGPWSKSTTWEGDRAPTAGDKVLVRTGHVVLYDVRSDQVIRSLHISGTLTFAHDRDTRLDVGLIKVQAGDGTDEDGFDCDAHLPGGPTL